jgi:predicted nuclease of predicted toxin-antitoxin system
MRFFLDANMPRSAIAVLSRFGHDVEFARDVGLGSASDEVVAAHVRRTKSVLLTRDLDFADVRRYPPDQYDGIVVLRIPDDMVAKEIAALIERFLSEPSLVDSLPKHLAIVEPERARFRPPLKPSA